MYIDMCIDACTDMCIGMFTDMHRPERQMLRSVSKAKCPPKNNFEIRNSNSGGDTIFGKVVMCSAAPGIKCCVYKDRGQLGK